MSKPKAARPQPAHPDASRTGAQARGQRAERWAALWLRLRGFRIVARNVRIARGEVDIIARRGQLLCFVEVKARDSLVDALAAVTPNQRRRIEAAAEAFLATRPDLGSMDIRFDVMAVAGRLKIHHLADAWRPGWP